MNGGTTKINSFLVALNKQKNPMGEMDNLTNQPEIVCYCNRFSHNIE